MSDFTAGQQAAIETLDCNLLVKAGAGAGKTRVLVERYLHILETGAADTDGIAAITFTRKAAREMKERIRDKVNERLAAASGGEDSQKWRAVAHKLDAVNISTIHSLCSRILREYPAEAGVDPDFGLLEELDETARLDEIWRDILEQAAKSKTEWLIRLLKLYSPAQIRQNFRPLFEVALTEGLIGPGLEKALWPEETAGTEKYRIQLKQAYRELFELVSPDGKKKLTGTQEKLLELQGQWLEIERNIDRADEDSSILDVLDASFKGMRGNEDLREALQQRKNAAEALRGAILDATVERMVPDLCTWFRRVNEAWQQEKRLSRLLTYDDLEKETEKLLRDHPDICARYNRRIRFLMVDECQDINERQRKIIYLLAGGDAETLRRRTLFAVGDEKQSIYRFRGADTRVFARVQEDICRSEGRIIELLDNFRSHRQLVAAFNDFFAELMPASVCEEETEGADTVDYQNLQSDRGEEGQSKVDLWVLDAEALNGEDARDREAEMIARRIRLLVDDPEHPVRYKDVAVLLRAFTRVASYEAAFAKAGIPYYVAGSRGFAERQEIMDVLGLLRFLDNPLNEPALFGVLRSPFFLLSDEALLRLRRSQGGDLREALPEAAKVEGLSPEEIAVAVNAGTLLERWLARRGFASPGQLIREAFAATGFDSLQLTQFMGVRRYANLQKLLEMADTFMSVEAGGIPEFLAYMERRAENEGEAEIDSEAGDTVRIMTIHKSKGLEFPVVIVPDLQRKFNSRAGMTVFVRGMGMGMKVPDSRGKLQESGRFRRIARMDNAMERAELKRVLYVAMTRAERHIVLSAVANQPKAEKNLRNATGWLEWIRHLLDLKGSLQEWPTEKNIGQTRLHIHIEKEKEETGAVPTSGSCPTAEKKPEPLSQDLQRNIGGIPIDAVYPKVLSPAYLSEFAACPRRYFYSHVCRMPEIAGNSEPISASASEVASRQLGTTFHRFLELLPNREVWQEMLTQALQETLLPQQQKAAEPTLRDWAARYAQSPLCAEAGMITADRREWAFQYRLLPTQGLLPTVWLSGQVDRVLFYPDGTLGIVDYKTDHMDADSAQKKTARYRLQLLGYALAAKAVFGGVVRDARLYFVRTGETASVDVGPESLSAAARELQLVAEFIRSHAEEAEYGCNLSYCPYCPFQKICLRDTGKEL